MMETADRAVSGRDRTGPSLRSRVRHRLGRAALLAAVLACLALPRNVSAAAIPPGVWLMDGEVAVEIYDCAGLLCGRILWLLVPRDPQDQMKKDKLNPDPALRERPLCGLTIIWGLRQTGPDRWSGGGFYNPDDGKTYNISAQHKSADVVVARIYVGIPFFGRTKTLTRVPHGITEGWC